MGLIIDVNPPAPTHPASTISGVVDLLEALAPLNVGGLLGLVLVPINDAVAARFEQRVVILLRELVIVLRRVNIVGKCYL